LQRYVLSSHLGDFEVIRHLVLKGANVNFEKGIFGSPLRAALNNTHKDAVIYLLKHGADLPNPEGLHGNTLQATMRSIPQSQSEIVIEQRHENLDPSYRLLKRVDHKSLMDFDGLEIGEYEVPNNNAKSPVCACRVPPIQQLGPTCQETVRHVC
jgi:ankyrin repeat protein